MLRFSQTCEFMPTQLTDPDDILHKAEAVQPATSSTPYCHLSANK